MLNLPADDSDMTDSLRQLEVTSFPWTLITCSLVFKLCSGKLWDLKRHFAIAGVERMCTEIVDRMVHRKGFMEPHLPLQSEQLCFGVMHTGFSNSIYLVVKVKALKQLFLKVLKVRSLSLSLPHSIPLPPSLSLNPK